MQSHQIHEEALRRAGLILKYLRGETSVHEEVEIEAWADEDPANRKFLEALEHDEAFRQDFEFLSGIDVSAAWKNVASRTVERRRKVFVPLRYAAAVAVLVTATALLFQTLYTAPTTSTFTAEADTVTYDIPPGGHKAVLELADGSTIVLEDAADGEVKNSNAVVINKRDNTLIYEAKGTDAKLAYNKVSTPTGGQFSVVLPDGTQVWLNAESSVRYPVAFTGDKRIVEMTGEVYFEVIRDESMPFLVQIGDATVEVLGTSFNVMAYDDEPSVNATLVSGAVRVSHGEQVSDITPGQQARIANGITVIAANVGEVLAWKTGYFQFNETGLASILRQLSRWYGVTVDYERVPNLHFTGMLSRDNNISEVLKMLELTGGISFRIDADHHVYIGSMQTTDSPLGEYPINE